MAVYTPISPSDLDALLAAYGLPPAERFEGITGGIENTNYRVFTGGRRLILTLYEGRTSLDDLPYFLSLMAHVADAGLSAAAPLRAQNGAYLAEISEKPCALIVHLEGADIAKPLPVHAFAAGAELARFHAATADFAPRRANALGPAAWTAASTAMATDLAALSQMAGGAAPRIAAVADAWPRGLPAGTIHADLFPDNVLFEKDGVSGIIDLYFACHDTLAYDLAIAMAAWTPERASGALDPRCAIALRAGYESIRALTDAEVAALPLLIEGAAWRFFLTRAQDYFDPRPRAAGRTKDPLAFLHLAQEAQRIPTHLTETP